MIEYSSDIYVKLVRSMASDDMVIQAAQVSSNGSSGECIFADVLDGQRPVSDELLVASR